MFFRQLNNTNKILSNKIKTEIIQLKLTFMQICDIILDRYQIYWGLYLKKLFYVRREKC